ncbi:hypothetical protein Ahia01_000863400 [Argonauta hians]
MVTTMSVVQQHSLVSVHLLQILFLIPLVSTQVPLIFNQCRFNTDCPLHATCMARSCDGYLCVCESGYRHSFDRTRCVPASDILNQCDFSDNCPPIVSLCLFRQCVCREGLQATQNRTCRGRGERALGDVCDRQALCSYPNLQCINGRCQCREGYRKKTASEQLALPYDMFQCIPANYSLNECNQIPLPVLPGITTTTTIASSSSSLFPPPPPPLNSQDGNNNNATNTVVRQIYTNCTSHQECPDFAVCSPLACEGYVCICLQGYVASRNATKCIKKSRISERCETSEQCPGEFSVCTNNGVCRCAPGLQSVDGMHCTVPGTSLYSYSCNATVRCAIPDTTCRNGVCSCISGLRPKTSEELRSYSDEIWNCIEVGFALDECNHVAIAIPEDLNSTRHHQYGNTSLQDRCDSSEECPLHASCQPRSCDLFICQCSQGYRQSADRTTCVKVSKLNESCESDANCPNQFAECNKETGRCKCRDNFAPVGDKYCKYASTVVYGDACNISTPCTYPDTECNNNNSGSSDSSSSSSSSGVCRCRGNFREKTLQETLAFPDLMFSCIKRNFSLDTCQGVPVTNLTSPSSSSSSLVDNNEGSSNGSLSRSRRDVAAMQVKLKIADKCSNDTECPDNASCVALRCNDYRCTCNTNYQESHDKNICIRVALIGETCNPEISCGPSKAECRPSGVCECKFPLLFRNGFCVLPNKLFLGQNCTDSSQCDASQRLYCSEGSCQCSPGFIPVPQRQKHRIFDYVCILRNDSFEVCPNNSSFEDQLTSTSTMVKSEINSTELLPWHHASALPLNISESLPRLNYTNYPNNTTTTNYNNKYNNNSINNHKNNTITIINNNIINNPNNNNDNINTNNINDNDNDDNEDENNNDDDKNINNNNSNRKRSSLREFGVNMTIELADLEMKAQAIGSNCSSDVQCHSNSACMPDPCGRYVCTCIEDFFDVGGLCRKVAGIGEECSSSSSSGSTTTTTMAVCYPTTATECKPERRCGCKLPFVLKNGAVCVFPGKSAANERCTRNRDCATGHHLTCTNGLCQCKPGYRTTAASADDDTAGSKDFHKFPGQMCIPTHPPPSKTCNNSRSASSPDTTTPFTNMCSDGSTGISCSVSPVSDTIQQNKALDHVLVPIAVAVLILVVFVAITVYSRKKCNSQAIERRRSFSQ